MILDNVKVMVSDSSIKYVVPNPNWNNPDKLAVAIASDKIVYLWDIKTLKIVTYHNKHTVGLQLFY